MRFKSLALGLTATFLLGGLLIFTTQQSKTEQKEEISSYDSKIERGYRGAVAYLHNIRKDPATGIIDPADYTSARQGLKKLSQAKAVSLNWTEMGPSNVGGRTRAILVDKDSANVIYAGGVSGGLWKSTTFGQSWVQIPLGENIAVSCIAQAPNGDIYVGTGEGLAQPSATNYNSGQYGAGVYKSTDGVSFNLLTNTSSWNLVNRIAIDKNGKIFLGTSNGLKTSTDEGANWTNSKIGNVQDIKIAPNGNIAVASISGLLYKTDNTSNENWVAQSSVPSGIRVEVGICPTDENYIYAVVASSTGASSGVFRTTDKGANWEQIGPASNPTSSNFKIFGDNNQGWYDIAVLVSPTNPDLVFVGGIDIWKGQKVVSGAPFAWTQITNSGYLPSNSHYVHADIHALVHNPINSDGFYVGSDGGFSETANNGASFVTKNINFNVTQMYAVACSPNGWAMGGTQDNSTPYVDGTGNNPKQARVLYGGDGGWAAFSALSQEILFATSQYGNIGRSNDNGDTWERPTGADGTTPAFFSQAMVNDNVDDESAFVTPFLLWETTFFQNSIDSVIYVADTTYAVGDTIWARSDDNDQYPFATTTPVALKTGDLLKVADPVESRFFFGASGGVYMCDQPLHYSGAPPRWYKIASITGDVQTMSLSKDGDVLFFTNSNKLYRVSNLLSSQDSSTLQYDETGYALQQTLVKNFSGTITSVAIDPSDNNRVAITLGGFSSSYPHVWYSQNATAPSPTFAARGGDLPGNLPVYASLIPMNNSNMLIIGTEFGVYGTENLTSASPSYVSMNDGIEDPVPVFMLRQQIYELPWLQVGRWDQGSMVYQVFPGIYNYGEIYAATHGRGLFKSTNFVGFREIDKTQNSFGSKLKLFPNPADDRTNIEFDLMTAGQVTLAIFDNSGRLIRTDNLGYRPQGVNKEAIDVSRLTKGLYFISLRAGNQSKQAKLIVQ
jgi:hypothetical protein